MAGGVRKSDDDLSPMAEINITPMVDVMLVLLIIFMVAAPLMENGIAIQLPKASAKALPPSEDIVTLNITKDKKIYINKRLIKTAALEREVKTFFKNRKDKQIFIRADHELPYGEVAKAMSTIKLAGINKIGLVTLPQKKKN